MSAWDEILSLRQQLSEGRATIQRLRAEILATKYKTSKDLQAEIERLQAEIVRVQHERDKEIELLKEALVQSRIVNQCIVSEAVAASTRPLQVEIEQLKELLRGIGANRYWEGRWRDEKADNERLRSDLELRNQTACDRLQAIKNLESDNERLRSAQKQDRKNRLSPKDVPEGFLD
jgi:hypothetical protein